MACTHRLHHIHHPCHRSFLGFRNIGEAISNGVVPIVVVAGMIAALFLI